MYHNATVVILLSRSWHVRKKAQQTVKKLLSSLGGSGFAHGLLGELRVVVNKHKVRVDRSFLHKITVQRFNHSDMHGSSKFSLSPD